MSDRSSVIFNSLWPRGLFPIGLLCPWKPLGKNTGMCSLSLLQGILLTPGSNPSLLHCWQILYHLNNQGSPPNLPRLLQCLYANRQSSSQWPSARRKPRARILCSDSLFTYLVYFQQTVIRVIYIQLWRHCMALNNCHFERWSTRYTVCKD